jgi:hypothetical protein
VFLLTVSLVKRGLVNAPELWKSSSYRLYAFGEHCEDGLVTASVCNAKEACGVFEFEEYSIREPSKTAKGAAPAIRYRKQGKHER